MKKILQGAILPFAIFASGLTLLGCDQTGNSGSAASEQDSSETRIGAQETQSAEDTRSSDRAQQTVPLKEGNLFYIVRDVADLQLRAGSYTEQLQQTRSELQNAVERQDHSKLQQAAVQLEQQLKDFDQALNSVQLKTQEISDIRQKLLDANQQVLKSPFLNGQVDISKIDFKKIEQQMGSIQNEMLKLAAMLVSQGAEQEQPEAAPAE